MDSIDTLHAFGIRVHLVPGLCERGLYLPGYALVLIRAELDASERRDVADDVLDQIVLTRSA